MTDEPEVPKRPRVDPEDIRKALEEQAKRRPPKSPPREMPVTPTLPRIHKRRRNRRKP